MSQPEQTLPAPRWKSWSLQSVLPVQFGDQMLLAAIFLIAAALRFVHVTQPLVDVFSWREASTAMMADNFRLHGWNIFFPEVSWTGPGPSYQGREFELFAYIVAILQAIFGWHDWFGRLVAVLFSLVTVFSLHRLVALVWNERHAHAAALSYAVMPGAIVIDSSFLPDPVMLAMITLGVWRYVAYWVEGGKGYPILATAAFTLGALSKLPGLGVGLVILWLLGHAVMRERWRVVGHTLLATALGLVVIAGYYSWAVYLGRSYPPYHVAGSGYIWDYGLARFAAENFYLDDIWDMAWWWFYGYPMIVLFGVGLWVGVRKFGTEADAEADPALVAVPYIWLLAGSIVYLVAAREISNNPWNLHVLHVPVAIFCGRGLIALAEIGGVALSSLLGIARLAVMLVAVVALSLVPLVPRLKDPQGEEARLMGQRLDQLAAPDDLVIAISPEVGDPIAIYYSRRHGWVFPPGGGDKTWSVFVEDNATAITQLEKLRNEGARWFAVTKNAKDWKKRLFVEHHAGVLAYLDQNAEKVEDTSNYLIYRLR